MATIPCDFCETELPDGIGLHMQIYIGPSRAEQLTARYGEEYKSGDVLVKGACEEHRPLLVPKLISQGFVG